MSLVLNPYLNFNGDCRFAMEFYHSTLGGELEMQSFASFGMPTSEAYKDKIMHAVLKNEWLTLMASDGQEGVEIVFGDSVTLSISGDDDEKLTNFFEKLSEGGKITMPLAKQVWGDKFGMFTDKFGIHWMVNINQHK